MVISNDDTFPHFLANDVSEYNHLSKNSLINFWYKEEALKSNTTFVLSIHDISGVTALRYRKCSIGTNLKKSMDECTYSKQDMLVPIDDIQAFKGKGQFVINHDAEGCINQTITDYLRESPPT